MPRKNIEQGIKNPKVIVVATIVLMLILLIPLGFEYLLEDTQREYLPTSKTFDFDSAQIWLHFLTDFIIGISYVAISTTLAWLAWRARRSLPFMWIFIAFAAFIVTCGFTHFAATWTLWVPAYYFAGGVKFVTAIASVATAVALPFIVPKALDLVEIAKVSEIRKKELKQLNKDLSDKNVEMEKIVSELQKEKEQAEKLNSQMIDREVKMIELKNQLHARPKK